MENEISAEELINSLVEKAHKQGEKGYSTKNAEIIKYYGDQS